MPNACQFEGLAPGALLAVVGALVMCLAPWGRRLAVLALDLLDWMVWTPRLRRRVQQTHASNVAMFEYKAKHGLLSGGFTVDPVCTNSIQALSFTSALSYALSKSPDQAISRSVLVDVAQMMERYQALAGAPSIDPTTLSVRSLTDVGLSTMHRRHAVPAVGQGRRFESN